MSVSPSLSTKSSNSATKFATPISSHKGIKLVVTPESDFELGQDILYTDGEGNQERVAHKGATPDGL